MKPLIIITGASGGVGAATAKLFSKNGFPLLLLARRLDKLKNLNLPNSICKKLDVTDYESFLNIVNEVAKDYEIGMLVNNAGIMPLDSFINQSHSSKLDTVNINLFGVINGMEVVLPHMTKAKSGTIINISSVAGRYTSDYHAVYNASKAAVNFLTEQVRKEVYEDNVRVLLLEPAIVDTNLLNLVDNNEILEKYEAVKKSLNGGLTPEEIAETILWMYNAPDNVSLKEVLISHTKQKI